MYQKYMLCNTCTEVICYRKLSVMRKLELGIFTKSTFDSYHNSLLNIDYVLQYKVGTYLYLGRYICNRFPFGSPFSSSLGMRGLLSLFQIPLLLTTVPNSHQSNELIYRAIEGHASLLFAHKTDIRKIDLDHHNSMVSIVNETRSSCAIDYNFRTGMIYWSDVMTQKIYK